MKESWGLSCTAGLRSLSAVSNTPLWSGFLPDTGGCGLAGRDQSAAIVLQTFVRLVLWGKGSTVGRASSSRGGSVESKPCADSWAAYFGELYSINSPGASEASPNVRAPWRVGS